MQNFTLNLSLNINIGTDGQVKVDVNTDKPQSIAVPHTPVIDVTPEPKVEEKSVVAKNSTTEEVVKPKKTKSKKREADVKPEPAVDTEPVEESGPELEPVAEHNSTAISESGSAPEPVAEPERAVAPEPVAEPEQAVAPPPPPAPKAVEPEVVEPTGKSDGQVLFEEALSDLGALTGFDITPDDFTFKKEGSWVEATETDTQAETSSDFEKAAGEFVDFLYGGNDTPKAEAKPEPAVVPPPPAPSAAPVPPAPASAQVPPPPPAGPFGGVPTPPPAPNVAMPTPPAPPVGGTPVAPKSNTEQLGGAAQPSTPSEQSKKNHRWQNLGFTNPEFAKKLDVNYRTATNGKQTTVAVVSPVPEVTPDDDSYTTFDMDMKTYRLNGKVVTPMRYLKAMHAAGNMLEMDGDPNDYRVCIDLNRPYAKPRMRNGDPAYFHPYYAEDQLDLDPMESWENWEDENVRRELRENENYIHDTMLFFGVTPELATTLCEADRQAMSVLGKLLAEAPDLPFIPEIREPWLAEYVAMKLGMKSVWYAGDGEYEFINVKKGNKLVDVVM